MLFMPVDFPTESAMTYLHALEISGGLHRTHVTYNCPYFLKKRQAKDLWPTVDTVPFSQTPLQICMHKITLEIYIVSIR